MSVKEPTEEQFNMISDLIEAGFQFLGWGGTRVSDRHTVSDGNREWERVPPDGPWTEVLHIKDKTA